MQQEDVQMSALWPASVHWENGIMYFGKLPATALVEKFSTPIYVLDKDEFSARLQNWVFAMDEAFSPEQGMSGAKVYYAAKAFLSADVVKWVLDTGANIDTASLGELSIAITAGAKGERLGIHGNNKSVEELRLALRTGVGHIVADSLDELDIISTLAIAMGVTARVMLRVNSGVHAGGHHFIATAHEDQKFGLSIASGLAWEAVKRTREIPNLELIGLHSHIGSQILALDAFSQAIERVFSLVSRIKEELGEELAEIDLGGGYAIRYREDDPLAPTPSTLAHTIANSVKSECQKYNLKVPFISIEPGRSIVGPAGVTLYSVGTIKDQPLDEGKLRCYVSVDGGMSDNIRPVLYDARYTCKLANREGGENRPIPCRVVGKHCESGDVLIQDIYLPHIQTGDILAVPATGAYGHVMSSNYNMALRPATVAVSRATNLDATENPQTETASRHQNLFYSYEDDNNTTKPVELENTNTGTEPKGKNNNTAYVFADSKIQLIIRRETIEDLFSRDMGI